MKRRQPRPPSPSRAQSARRLVASESQGRPSVMGSHLWTAVCGVVWGSEEGECRFGTPGVEFGNQRWGSPDTADSSGV